MFASSFLKRLPASSSPLQSLQQRMFSPQIAKPAAFFAFNRTFSSALSQDEITQRVVSVVQAFEKVNPEKVTPTAHFNKDLALDSLDSVELVMAIEDEFCVDIPDEAADKITSVPEAVNYLFSNPNTK